MNNFKVGDKVVFTPETYSEDAGTILSPNWAKQRLVEGDIYTVNHVEDNGNIIVKESDPPLVFNKTQFTLESEFKKQNMKLEITREKVLEAAGKCSTAADILKTLFPEAFDRSVDCRDFPQITLEGISNVMECRERYEYAGHAIYLNNTFNWELKKDSNNMLCLIPTKK